MARWKVTRTWNDVEARTAMDAIEWTKLPTRPHDAVQAERVAHRVSKLDAQIVLRECAAVTGLEEEDFALYPAEHESMSEGCWSIAYEGWTGETEWPRMVTDYKYTSPKTFPRGVFLEPMTSWSLGIYPERED